MKPKDLSKYVAGQVTKRILLYTFLLLVLLSSQVCVQGSTRVTQTYTISGQLTDGFGNALSGWTVTLRGTQTATTTTDTLGNYSFASLQAGGSYTVGPASGGPNTLTFSKDVNNLSSDVTVNLVVLFFVNFQVWVRDSSGNGVAAVAIRVNNEPVAFAQTNSFGMVNLGVNIPGTNNGPPVTLTPEKPGYVFSPSSVTLSTQNGTQVVNFIASISNSPLVQFGVASYAVGEGNQRVNITVTRTGDNSGAASVGYATIDDAASQPCSTINGIASPRCDYLKTIGTIQFGAGETSKLLSVVIIDDSYAESGEVVRISLNNPQGATLGTPSTASVTIIDNDTVNGPNPIDAANWFVPQHYLDFLNREPDPPGFGFWTGEIDNCTPKPQCIELKRIFVSAAFYISIEFQGTGYLVERIYKTSYGDASGMSTFGGTHQLPVPIVRFNEFLPDTQEIGLGVVVGQGNWQQQLENNKQAFCAEFVQRSRFTTAFPSSMTAAQFVDALNTNAGSPLSQSERDQLVTDLSTSAKTRAQVLRAVAEDQDLNIAEFNRAFVLMQYFGYLRRNPNDPQDTDYTGYDFWLTKLSNFTQPGDDALVRVQKADMVKAFITSAEYRNRFGP